MLSLLKRGLNKKGFGRNIAILASGTALGQALIIFSSPLLTRLFTPEEFGVYAVYGSALVILLAMSSFRYEMAIPLPESDEASINLLALALLVLLGFTTLLSVGLYFFGSGIVTRLNASQLSAYLWLFPISLMGAGGYQILNAWAIRRKQFKEIAKTKLNQSVGMVATQVGAGFFAWGQLGLLLGDAVGRTSGSSTLAFRILQTDKGLFKEINLPRLKMVAKRYIRFPIFSSWSSALNTAGVQLPSILFATLYSPEVAGLFMLSQRIVGAPMGIIGQSVSQVYLAEISTLKNKDPQSVRELFLLTRRRLFKVGCVPIIILGVASPFLFAFVFGDKWAVSGKYISLLAPMFLLQFVVSPISQNAVVFEKQKMQLLGDSLRVVMVVLSILIPSYFDLSSSFAIASYSVTMTSTYFGFLKFYSGIVTGG